MGRESSSSISASRVKESINHIISSALSSGVRTIHIEPGRNFIVVRFRRGTRLEVVNKLPRSSAEEFSTQLKKLANLDTAKKLTPQYGLTKLEVAKKLHQFRVTTLPVIDGEKITIDVLDAINQSESLESIGLWGSSLRQVQDALAANHGLILIASPQLRPAQDTLAIMLGLLDSASHSLAYIGPTNSQIPRSTDIKNGDDSIQKLKLLPAGKHTVVGIGLVDSRDLARQVNDLVIKKQHIIAVLPALSSLSALSVWRQMIGQLLVLPMVIAEHRVTRLCDSCKVAYQPTIIEQIQLSSTYHLDNPDTMRSLHELEKLAIKAGLGSDQEAASTTNKILKLWRPNQGGCRHCNFTGYQGDIGIFEVLQPTEQLRTTLLGRSSATEAQDVAEKEGMISLKSDALVKALRGLMDFKTLINIDAITG